jgi:hypothetical protein
MFSPTLGRFVSTDPTGFQAGDVNLYRFVGNDPPNLTDPSGLAAPDKHTIPVDTIKAMEKAWADSKHGTPNFGERGIGYYVTMDGKLIDRPGTVSKDGKMWIPDGGEKGEKMIGSFHTHPYADEKSIGISFSAGDVVALLKGHKNWSETYSYVMAGDTIYLLIVQDSAMAKALTAQDFTKLMDAYERKFRELRGTKDKPLNSFRDSVEGALQSILPGTGLAYYKVEKGKDNKFPTEMKLICDGTKQ